MPNVMAALPNIGGTFCSTPQSLAHAHYYSVFQKSDAKIQITTAYLIRIKYPLSGFNYHLSDVNVANFNKIHCTVFEQQLFKKLNSKTEISNMENTD